MKNASDRAAIPRPVASISLVTLALLAAGCQGTRFDGSPPTAYAANRVTEAPADLEPLDEPIPSSPVISSPLPPAPGTDMAPQPNFPGDPAQPRDMATLGPPSGIETLGGPPPVPAGPPPATRSSATGSWTAREAAGGSCKMVLSSSPSLDLYKASTAGCANKDLQSVNAWEFRDGQVYLYARGGVVARLRDAGGSFSGALAKSGAPLTITR